MLVTHTTNSDGDHRVYLGSRASIECWLEPAASGGWTLHVRDAVTANGLTDADRAACTRMLLEELAAELDVPFGGLMAVPFATIAALHTPNPFLGGRIPAPRREFQQAGFVALDPGCNKPVKKGGSARRSARRDSAPQSLPEW